MMKNPIPTDDLEGNDTMGSPPESESVSDMGAMMANNEICVDLDSLAMPDEGEQMQPPAVGDKVQASVEGTVSRIVGNKAYVTMSAVNGKEVAADAPAPTDTEEESNLQQMAAGQPDRY